MRQDILTLSRVHSILTRNGVNLSNFNVVETSDYATVMSVFSDEEIVKEVYEAIKTDDRVTNIADMTKFISEYLIYISKEQKLFSDEIEKRKKHVIDLNIYIEDTEEDLLKKLEEIKDMYATNYYLDVYTSLERENIKTNDLTISEAMLINESISCQTIIKGSMELLAYIENERKSFCEVIKKLIKHANFYAFALDIYNDVEKMYEEVNKKDKK